MKVLIKRKTIVNYMGNTKVIITSGPSCDEEKVMERIFRAGISSVRINTAHAEEGYIKKITKMIHGLNEKLSMHVSVMVDLKGPELRTKNLDDIEIKEGKEYSLSGESGIVINYPQALKNLEKNDTILMSDGKIKFRVIESMGNKIKMKALTSGILRARARVNIPGKYIEIGSLTDRDMVFLKEGIENNVDFFALSFVQKKENVIDLQKRIIENGGNQEIISKIETKSGFSNIEEIVNVSDYIMVARGDLGVEMPIEEVGITQKKIIEVSHRYGVPTIVATEMLESMVDSETPTRAEVSDVTNAIIDNADALMLTSETAIGKYPVDVVLYINKIIDYVEKKIQKFPEPEEFLGNRVAFSIAKASKVISEEIKANGIIAFTRSGNTARMLSAVRPSVPIYPVVTEKGLARRVNLLRGTYPFVYNGKNDDIFYILKDFQESMKLKKGTRYVVTSGSPFFLFGGTNGAMVITVGEFLGRGTVVGKSIEGKATYGKKGNILVLKNKTLDFDENFKGYDAFIFLDKVSHDVLIKIKELDKTAVYNTKIYRDIKEGDEINIDSHTGIINK